MIPLLPKWHLHGNRPTFYDGDAVTMLELASTLHGSMNTVIDEYNKLADSVNRTITEFMESTDKDLEVFETAIRQEFQDFIDVVTLKISAQDKELEELDRFVRTNLSDAISTLLKEMEESGELDETIVNNISGVIDVIAGIRRKILAITGSVRKNTKDIEAVNEELTRQTEEKAETERTNKCRVTGVTDNEVTVTCMPAPYLRTFTINTNPTSPRYSEFTKISGYAFTKSSVFAGTAEEKNIVSVWVDGVEYESVEVLKDTSLTFDELTIHYETTETINGEQYTLKTSVICTVSGVEITESIDEGAKENLVTSFISHSKLVPIMTHGTHTMVFRFDGQTKRFVETVEQFGNTVVKKIHYRYGGVK